MNFDKDYYFEIIKELMLIDSPSGFTKMASDKVIDEAKKFGYDTVVENNESLCINVKGESEETIAFSAHLDTLGLMTRAINSDGTLSFTSIGGVNLATVDGEYVKIYTKNNKIYTGVICSNSYSAHVYKDAGTLERNEKNMHIILDEDVSSKDDVLNLGIKAGDFICIDPKICITESGFIKSRFLDDKASVAIFLTYLKYLKDEKITPKRTIKFLFSVNEEVGFGLSYLDKTIKEIIAVDMGCVGDDLSCTEFEVSICAKDSSGPYSYDIVESLIKLSEENDVKHAVDIYPMYSSDVSAARRAGQNIRGGLIGMGVRASHGVERTHIKGVLNTIKLIHLYIMR